MIASPSRGLSVARRAKAVASEGWAVIEVKDTGTGIPPDALPHIFDRFYRSDPARQAGQDQGAGLGLAIAREIVLAHHGTITAQSAPGEGSTFKVCLPLMPDLQKKSL